MQNEETITGENGIIRLLPASIANKIAAGEVVQRPSSVIKELLDNAIDAGATSIQVYIQQAGRTMVQVDDNGCGMSRGDIPNCFLRHATSKITSLEDLYAIRTLGFRGEAMASIASVAQVTLKTKRVEDESGYMYEVWGGEEKAFEPAAVQNGTSISVKNLFYNVPARRAFLKSDSTELRHCIIVFQQMALTNPEIAFQLNIDGEPAHKLPSQSLAERITSIFGKSYQASLIPVDETAGFVRIHGYLSDPKLAKKNRGEQFLFVNGRPVMHRHLTYIILEQYRSWISDSQYPFFALFFDVDPAQVDVNVHPSKMEIKFEDEKTISGLTKSVVRRALNQQYQVPDLGSIHREDNEFDSFQPFARIDTDDQGSGRPVHKIPSRINFHQGNPRRSHGFTDALYGEAPANRSSQDAFDAASAPGTTVKGERPESGQRAGFWQLHKSYIMTQTISGMCVIDQHTAHKRIIYERALASMDSGLPSTQQLLFPQTLQLSATDHAELREVLPELLRMGFDIDLMSGFSAMINGVPADIQLGDEQELIQSIIQQYKSYPESLNLKSRERLALAMASRTAVPRGKVMSQSEMEAIVDQLFACTEPYQDPLRKPTIVYVPLDEIRSRFRSSPRG